MEVLLLSHMTSTRTMTVTVSAEDDEYRTLNARMETVTRFIKLDAQGVTFSSSKECQIVQEIL